MIPPSPRSTLFPYTTLFRSILETVALDNVITPQKKEELVKKYEKALKDHHKDRKSTRLNSSHVAISYAVFCLKKKKKILHETLLNSILYKPTRRVCDRVVIY